MELTSDLGTYIRTERKWVEADERLLVSMIKISTNIINISSLPKEGKESMKTKRHELMNEYVLRN